MFHIIHCLHYITYEVTRSFGNCIRFKLSYSKIYYLLKSKYRCKLSYNSKQSHHEWNRAKCVLSILHTMDIIQHTLHRTYPQSHIFTVSAFMVIIMHTVKFLRTQTQDTNLQQFCYSARCRVRLCWARLYLLPYNMQHFL